MINRRYLKPFPGEPWLQDLRPRCIARNCALGGLASSVLGLLGPPMGMLYWVAAVLLFGGMIWACYGFVTWCAALMPPLTQVCPDCYSVMARGAACCPFGSRHGRRPRAHAPVRPRVVRGCGAS